MIYLIVSVFSGSYAAQKGTGTFFYTGGDKMEVKGYLYIVAACRGQFCLAIGKNIYRRFHLFDDL
jgi:hypothetical protein